MPIVGLFAVLVGLATIVARQEIAVALLARQSLPLDDRRKKTYAYLWLLVGTAMGIAGMLLFALTVER